ncbi:MAG TPA: glucosamine-6-phosphate deaminase [Tepidisphaeraceae bacterium]|jgi:glucosamine-6-phosphate deaminase|nr:glucosamine-6-phosphate deaminase [Tepidisphaeraceae bacterium]
MQIEVAENKQLMGAQAAAAGAKLIRAAVRERGGANIIVATGASQFEMLAALAQEPDVPWNRVTAFHLDEYVGLPITHPASFRLYLWERFHRRLPLPPAAFHYIDAEGNPIEECRRLGALIERHPIDVAFIGIGENAHVAFNDPPADFDAADPYLVVGLDDACRRQQLGEGWFPTFEDVPKQAISMSCRQILRSRAIVCTVPDKRKAQAVQRAVEGPVTPEVPASILQKHEEITLHLDREAASLLRR